ncbi:hypothetical protein HNQ02_002821 [Flavobacterium sp. 7E]|uniref:hypothetical protein n=1 Tax=Flavobacterium sp. 7E TaxID=2735898 RepID=UPI00156EF10E|nr:hypothetical protein [Flavobacterium sp. 7E]NRS89887.1 hypothetical protein [Flavobacterium sp. 7E]
MNYIKLILIITTTIIFNSCKLENKGKKNIDVSHNETIVLNELPIGVNLLLNTVLPEKIIYQYDEKEGLNLQEVNLTDSISILSSNYYENLKINREEVFSQLPQIKKNIIYNISDKNNMIYFLDSCYFSKTIFYDGNLKLKLFKDGGKYNSQIGNENNSVTNYIILAVYNNLDKLIDYKTIYYNETLYYANNSMYFFLDKKLKPYLVEYKTEEDGIYLVRKREYTINNKGEFVLIKDKPTDITNEDKINDNSITLNDKISDFCKDWEGIYWFHPFELDANKIGNYYIDYFKDHQDFGLSGGSNSFKFNIMAKSEGNKLYIFKKDESDFSQKNAEAIITKMANNYYINSKRLNVERSDIKKNDLGYLINWAKTIEEIED